MSKTWAILVDNVIGNVVVADQEFIESHPDFSQLDKIDITDYDPMPGVAWKLEDNKFIAPEHVKPKADHVLDDGLHEIEVKA
jgi:DNA primase